MLCLENAEHASGQATLQPQCRHELASYRQLLLSDYKVNPEIILSCAQVRSSDRMSSTRVLDDSYGLHAAA